MCFKSADMYGGGKNVLFPRSQFYVSESHIDGDAVWKWVTQVKSYHLQELHHT